MASAKEKPLYANPSDYEDDFYAWAYEQAELLRLGRFREADLTNIIEELETLGRTERRSLVSAYRLVLMHLLKWQFQPTHRSNSWRNTVRRERKNIKILEQDNPSLAAVALTLVAEAYADAIDDASDETELPLTAFPTNCPYTLDQIRDPDFLPE